MDNVARPCETFPSAPNWFGAAISAVCSSLELYVYASRNRVIALNSNTLRVQNSFIASQHKLHAIAIHGTICATTGQDKAVRCWNLDNCKLENGHLRHQAEINALCWAKKGTVLISGDKHGQLSIWDRSQDVIASKVHINNTIRIIGQTVIQDEDIIAVGYANGMIIVGKLNSLQQFEIIYRLEHQIDEIQSLRWQYTQPFEQNTGWPKLASGSRDGSLVIWDVPNEDVCRKISPPKDKQMTNNQQSRVFTVVAWSTLMPERLFFSSLNGDIMYIDIDKAIPKSNKLKRFTELHSRSVFGIDIVDDGRFAISHSMDRSVVKWDTSSIKKEFSIRTMGGIPYSMDISKEDVTKMAVALSDSNIKIWNVPISKDAFSSLSSAGDLYRSDNIWKGLKGKITKASIRTLKWHPQNEGSLVFGTEHGSVSLIDTYSGKTISFKSYHKATVYSLDWVTSSDAFTLALQGNGSSQGPWVLSCDGRSVYVHDSMKPAKQAVNIDDAFREHNSAWIQSVQEKGISRCDVAVDNETGLLALGNTDGSIEVYSLSNMKLVYTANNQTKTINCMAWKPKRDGQHSYLATGSADTTICAHYLGETDNTKLQDIPLPATTFLQVFKGHLEGITDLAWQPGETENKLASSSSDGNILIWDLEHERPLNCIPSFIRVLSLCWSLTIPYTLFSGNEDHCIHVWKTDELRIMEENEQVIKKSINSVNWNRKMIAKPSKNGITNGSEARDIKSVPAKRPADQQQPGRMTINARKKVKGNAESGIFTRLEASMQTANRIGTCYECLQIATQYGAWNSVVRHMEEKTLDNLGDLDTVKAKEMLEACTFMKQSDLDTFGDPSSLASALFESKNRVRDMVDEEVDAYSRTNTGKQISGVTDATSKASFDPRILLDVMRNTCESIDTSDSRNEMVTTEDWVALALAPMFSRELWEEKVVRLAAKLDITNNPHGAVICYLAAFQVYPAIDVYRRAKLYKEAIALAKMRLPDGSDIISELFNEWGAHLETLSQYEFAAKCYLQSKRAGYELNALNALARPNDAVALYWSTAIADALLDASAPERFNLWIAELKRQISESTKAGKETLDGIVEIDTAAQLGHELQPIVIVECTRFAPAPIVVVRRESTPDGQPPVIIVRGEGLPNKNPVILDRRRNKLKPIIIIDQREDMMFFDGPPGGDMMMGNHGPILDEAGNPIMGIPQGMAYGDMDGNGGMPGMPEPTPTPGMNNSNFPRSSYLRRKPLRVFPAFMDGDDSITIGHPPSDSGSTTSSLSDLSSESPYPPQQQYHSNLAPIPESYNHMAPDMEVNGNRRVRFDEGPPQQHVYEREQSDDEGTYDEPYEHYMPAQGGNNMPPPPPNWNYPPEQENSMRMPQPMQQRASFDPSWNRPVVWTDEPQQLPNGNWPMPKPRWQLNHAAV